MVGYSSHGNVWWQGGRGDSLVGNIWVGEIYIYLISFLIFTPANDHYMSDLYPVTTLQPPTPCPLMSICLPPLPLSPLLSHSL